jgi:hypothetical protein
VGGSVANPLSLNAYLYCRDDPVDNIDPTGMVMPGDEKRSAVDQAAIAAATFAWNKANAAGDAAGKAAAHAVAEYVRNNPSSGNTNINITPRVSGEKTNINDSPYPGMGYHSLPPSGTTVLMKALSETSKKALSIDEVRKIAHEWMVPVETVKRLQSMTTPITPKPTVPDAPKPKPTAIAPIEPIPKFSAIAVEQITNETARAGLSKEQEEYLLQIVYYQNMSLVLNMFALESMMASVVHYAVYGVMPYGYEDRTLRSMSYVDQDIKDAFRSDAIFSTLTEDRIAYRFYGGDSLPSSNWFTPDLVTNPLSST